MTKDRRKTKEQLLNELGEIRQGLLNWKHQKPSTNRHMDKAIEHGLFTFIKKPFNSDDRFSAARSFTHGEAARE